MSSLSAKIFFTSLDGYEAQITGDEPALRAIEEALERAGIRFNEQVGTWDEGFYSNKTGD